MLIKESRLEELSRDIRRAIDGQRVDFRDNREGAMSVLKNDIHTLVSIKNEQLEAVRREHILLEEYLANVSHQLKTPITSMRIMADLLETAPDDKREEFVTNIKTGLTRMEWLTATLLKMARIDSGSVNFAMEEISAGELVKTALEPLGILLEIKDQRVELFHDTDLLCDPRWTAEALTNIIKNASEYSPHGSQISIDCGRNPIYSWVSVTDAGKGIATEDMAELFKRFQGSRSETGYGIGLPLALSIIRGQGGDIDVDGGGKGTGATFTVKLFK